MKLNVDDDDYCGALAAVQLDITIYLLFVGLNQ